MGLPLVGEGIDQHDAYMYLDSGTPQNYRQMDGYGVHAFRWVNAQGKVMFVKYKWTSMQGYLNTNPRTVAAELVKDPREPQTTYIARSARVTSPRGS